MLDAFSNLLAPPVIERLTLVLNHVLRSEPVALERLLPHAGRTVLMTLTGWPPLLPPPPPLQWRITPAGMLEWCGLAGDRSPQAPTAAAAPAADLRITVDARNPAALLARALTGERPMVQVDGDAALAADIGWLLENLRWDVAADLERFFGPAVAHQLHQLGRALARGLRAALEATATAATSTAPWTERFAEWSSRLGAGRR